MNKKLFSLFFAVALCFSLAIPVSAEVSATGTRDAGMLVLDDADLLTDSEEASLNERLNTISQAYQAEVVVATIPSMNGGDVDVFVEEVYDGMGFGYGSDHDGVLLLVCMDPREYRILSNGFAADAITSDNIESIGDWIVSYLSDGDYASAFEEFANECEYYLNGYINGYPFEPFATLLIALGVGFPVGLITVIVMWFKLKSVHQENRAKNYVKPGSMKLTRQNDIFLYQTVSRTKKETESSSRSSGSSRNVGGGSF